MLRIRKIWGKAILINNLQFNISLVRNLGLKGGNYNFEWFNPFVGKVTEVGSFEVANVSRSFKATFDGDTVLYLKRKD